MLITTKLCLIKCKFKFFFCTIKLKNHLTWKCFIYVVYTFDVYKDKVVIQYSHDVLLYTADPRVLPLTFNMHFDLRLWYYPIDFVARYFMLLHNALAVSE